MPLLALLLIVERVALSASESQPTEHPE